MRPLRLAAVSVLLALLAGCRSSSATGSARDPAFPDAWLGTWRGTVTASNAQGVRSTFEMQLTIQRTEDPSRLIWQTIYEGQAGRQVRDYELVVRNSARGEYAIDEKNGIVLEARLLGGALYNWFKIRGARLLVRKQLHDAGTEHERLSFEIVTSSDAATRQTGRDTTNYPVTSVQRAELRRTHERRSTDRD